MKKNLTKQKTLSEQIFETYCVPGLVAYVLGTCLCDYCKMIRAIQKNHEKEELNREEDASSKRF